MTESMKLNAGTAKGRRSVKRWLVGGAVVLAASVALSAFAHGMGGRGMDGGMMGMGMMGGADHMARGVDHMLDGLNASEAQRTQIKQIVQAAAADMKTQREAGRGLRDKAAQIFAAPNVDAAAAESLRQQMSAQHEQASKRMLQAMLDVAKVLTPEQRAKAAERMKQRGERMNERLQRSERDRPRQ